MLTQFIIEKRKIKTMRFGILNWSGKKAEVSKKKRPIMETTGHFSGCDTPKTERRKYAIEKAWFFRITQVLFKRCSQAFGKNNRVSFFEGKEVTKRASLLATS